MTPSSSGTYVSSFSLSLRALLPQQLKALEGGLSRRIEALANPAVLNWARRRLSMSLTVAAEKASIPVERLRAWEAGRARPTVTQLRKLVKVYHQSLAVFFLPSPPDKLAPTVHDFRRLPGGEAEAITPEIVLELDEASDRRAVTLELRAAVDAEPIAFRRHASLGDGAS